MAEEQARDVQPFGGVKWTDGVSEAVAKLMALGPAKGELALGSKYKADAKGLTDSKEVDKVLSALLRKAADGPNEKMRAQELKTWFVEFKDPSGKSACYWKELSFRAEPFVIHGAVYRLEASFVSYPGLAKERPQNVLWVDGEPRLAAPYALNRLDLIAVVLTPEQRLTIYGALAKKYAFVEHEHIAAGAEGHVNFTAANGVEYLRLNSSREKLAKVYNDMIVEQSMAGKKDQLSQL
jgi:hypothetical protein